MDEQNSIMPICPWLLPALAEDLIFRDVSQGRTVNGRPAIHRLMATEFRRSFARIQLKLLRLHTGEGTLLLELAFSGHHCGHFAGIPPTGRSVSLRLTMTCGVRDGRIHNIELAYDAADLLQQLGFIYQQGDET